MDLKKESRKQNVKSFAKKYDSTSISTLSDLNGKALTKIYMKLSSQNAKLQAFDDKIDNIFINFQRE